MGKRKRVNIIGEPVFMKPEEVEKYLRPGDHIITNNIWRCCKCSTASNMNVLTKCSANLPSKFFCFECYRLDAIKNLVGD